MNSIAFGLSQSKVVEVLEFDFYVVFSSICSNAASEADIISINDREENEFIQRIFQTHWHGPEYIPLGMFFDTDGK